MAVPAPALCLGLSAPVAARRYAAVPALRAGAYGGPAYGVTAFYGPRPPRLNTRLRLFLS